MAKTREAKGGKRGLGIAGAPPAKVDEDEKQVAEWVAVADGTSRESTTHRVLCIGVLVL